MSAPAEQTIIQEGKARIPVPATTTQDVFYNPIQEFNRDMSIAAINVWSKMYLDEVAAKKAEKPNKKPKDDAPANPTEINVLEALSATGLRAIRYAKECDHVKHILANDFDASAAAAIKRNAEFNDVLGNMVMYQSLQAGGFPVADGQKMKFMVVDLDPYGTAAPFLDAAVRSVGSGGLLCVTCTDMAVLAGSQWEACWAKYGSMPIPNASFCHEMGLRMLLQSIQNSAARYGRAIEPLMSCSIDFYVRVFVRVTTNAALCKQMVSKASMIYSCVSCRAHHTSPMGSYSVDGPSTKFKNPSLPKIGSVCEQCGSKFHIGGPFFSGPIHNTEFVSKMIEYVKAGVEVEKFKTHQRMIGMLTVISEELPDVPLFYSLDSICQAIHCSVPPLRSFFSALVNAGYKVSSSHCMPTSFKTDAPNSVIWDILRCWVKEHPISEKRMIEGSVSSKILTVQPTLVADFTRNKNAEPESTKVKLVRYQQNPVKNWGPKAKAKPGANANPKNAAGKRPREDDDEGAKE
ncbi:TRM-domain-containing protein [Rhizoclosmatium globosum]|uniref:tRNA (guanine(26)-N(2))-dimethyltransferase n=1 Tax=Rhizoclosmatium globosum TaxID=329046 RepID=A0A1Y2C479_9FUNG|nr:TRM-domain-containing protein [Rhizoclosmatium globosum]|eukprot:ORY41694.1 TRM-domain-containing protein [Rhizoclosmatium globosum]